MQNERKIPLTVCRAAELSRPGEKIEFMFNFTPFPFLAPDSGTMTGALWNLLQLGASFHAAEQ